MKYLILQHPGHNRVYYKQSEKLAYAELLIASRLFKAVCKGIECVDIAGVRYLMVETESELHSSDVKLLSGLSFVFAIFKYEEPAFFPMQRLVDSYVDDKISSVQKYHGKTNELFTRMMISVGMLSGEFFGSERIRVLDPVAGRGTTLYEAATLGYDAYGVEIDGKAAKEGAMFFRNFLKNERYKHEYQFRPVAGSSKKNAIKMHDFEYAKNRDLFNDVSERKHLGIVEGDTASSSSYFKSDYFHLIVGDLPYGIVHGNKDKRKAANITRNPSDLLRECLPEWQMLLKKGGAIVLAWNAFLVPYTAMVELLTEMGFDVLCDEPYNQFEHMVDKSIKRNIVVAIKR